MRDALTHTNGEPRMFVAYEAYFADWQAQARRLSTFVGNRAPSRAQSEAIGAHIDGALRHHTRGGKRKAALPGEYAALYAALSELAQLAQV
jgi:hypothetical protein